MLENLATREPDRAFIQVDDEQPAAMERSAGTFTHAKVRVACQRQPDGNGMDVTVHAPGTALAAVVLRWSSASPPAGETLYLADHWERTYGDLSWQHLRPERVMPWYVLAHDPRTGRTTAAGVQTQPSAMCFWTVDARGVSLWLDLRNGGMPSTPGDRVIAAATVVSAASEQEESPVQFATRFCQLMCPQPRLPSQPVVGNNNWYYAYGRNFNADTMRRDAGFLAELSQGHQNRPFCVIDAGWTAGSSCPGGPWTHSDAPRFPDMARLAEDMAGMGVRPGIWIRPTALTVVDDTRRLRSGPQPAQEKALDLTLPENLAIIREDIARMAGWGYELIKHDFSTYDLTGQWGFQMGARLCSGNWHFADRSRTNAEIVLNLYQTLREGAGDALLLGCNTIGHLGAGLFEVQRIGDDTSGRVWERTRRMGVNTLAFRLCQHNTFFAADADCAAHTPATPWEKDAQWLDLVARSGTPLFISVDPTGINAEKRQAFQQAVQTALNGGEAPGQVEPLDWLYTPAPQRWRFGQSVQEYDWAEPWGALPYTV